MQEQLRAAAKYRACSQYVITQLLRTPTITKHVAKFRERLDELMALFTANASNAAERERPVESEWAASGGSHNSGKLPLAHQPSASGGGQTSEWLKLPKT
jgi:hypothetical protein